MEIAEEKKGVIATVVAKIPDFIALLLSIAVGGFAYLIFTNKVPPNFSPYTWVYQHFYILATVGVLGFLGEQIASTILIFVLPVILIGSTLAFKFKPEKYPVEEWWEVYSLIVLFSAGYLVYLFYRWEQAKKSGGAGGKDLNTRVDPAAAARYRADMAKKEAAGDIKIEGVKDTDYKKKKKKEEKPADPIDPNETPEQRMEREMRTMKEDFNKKSMRLSTTLLRVKNLCKTLDRDEIFANVLEIISKGLDADRVQLLLNDEKEGKLRVVRAEGMTPKEYKDLVIPHEDTGIIAFLARKEGGVGEGGALGVKECEIDPKMRGLVGQGVIKTVIASPIVLDGKVFAILNVEKMKNPDYTRDDQTLMATCADVSGLVMKNAKLYAATMDDLVSTKKISEDQLKKNEELKGSLTRIVSPAVAEMIMKDPSNMKLGGQKCTVTVFFSDIRGFTNMSEKLDPEALVNILNIYFTKMTDILMELDGTLDKYVGDELMALFGAPVARPDDAIRAVLCGVKHILELKKLQQQFASEGKPVFSIGIGINTGEVTAGYMGSEKQLSYTVIGDNVNLGARLCSAAKKEEVIISKTTYDLVKDYFEFDALEPIMVKGKSMPIEIFRVKGVKPDSNLEAVIGQGKTLGSLTTLAADSSPVDRASSAMDMSNEALKKQNIQIDTKPKIIECQNCGTENDAQTKFCCKCGMPIF